MPPGVDAVISQATNEANEPHLGMKDQSYFRLIIKNNYKKNTNHLINITASFTVILICMILIDMYNIFSDADQTGLHPSVQDRSCKNWSIGDGTGPV